MDYEKRYEFIEKLKNDNALDYKDKRFLASISCVDTLLEIQKQKVKEYQQLIEMNHVLFVIFFCLHHLMKSHSMIYYSWIIMIAFNTRFGYVIDKFYKKFEQTDELYYRRLYVHLIDMKKSV